MNKGFELQLALPSGSLETYIQSVITIPMLSAERERELALRFRENSDLSAARQLVLSHLRFVVHVARGYSGYGLAQADLIQEGNIGLMKAVKRFDPNVGVRLVSFAVHWIRAEMHEFILKNWRIVKVATTKAQRKLFFNLRSSKKRLGWLNKEEVDAVAKDLRVTPKDVLEMESRLNGRDIGFDGHDEDDGQHSNIAPIAYLPTPHGEPASQVEAADWAQHHKEKLYTALEKLDTRSRDIISHRWLNEDKNTLKELAERYSVSAERIRQLENRAIKQLKVEMLA